MCGSGRPTWVTGLCIWFAGRYSIVEKQRSSTHLVWLLEVPKEPGDVQQDLCISKEGNLALSIKVCEVYNKDVMVGTRLLTTLKLSP